jgi:hypothetical protein
MDYDFFISYSSEDRSWAEWIAWQLEDAGYRTVLQPSNFVPGENFLLQMEKMVQDVRHVIPVLSPSYLKSRYAAAEWSAALARDPTNSRASLIPVRVQSCQVPGPLANLVYIDLVGLKEDQARKALLSALPETRSKTIHPPEFPSLAMRGLFLEPRDQNSQVHEMVKRSVQDLGGELVRFDFESANTGSSVGVLDEVRKYDFVIADISKADPNVMLELGFAIALHKPVLILIDDSSIQTGIPSNLTGYTLVTYSSDSLKEEALAKSVHHFIRHVL